MGGYSREEDKMYSVSRRFAEMNLKECPFCGEEKPKWLFRDEWKLLGREYFFKCPECESILKASQDEVSGLALSAASPAGKKKMSKGKDLKKTYFYVEKIGLSVKTPENSVLAGEELPLDEIKNYTKK